MFMHNHSNRLCENVINNLENETFGGIISPFILCCSFTKKKWNIFYDDCINPLNTELNPICQ